MARMTVPPLNGFSGRGLSVQQQVFEAQSPAVFCSRFAAVAQAFGEGVATPAPPVLWISPRSAHFQPAHAARTAKAPPHEPLWWAGSGGWRSLAPSAAAAPHAHAQSSYVPRRFEPPFRCGSVVLPEEAPLEEGPPGQGQPHHSGVMQVLRALICKRDGALWACSATGGAPWCRCPHQPHDFDLERTLAFELSGGDRYAFLLYGRGGAASLGTALLYNLARNEWLPLVGPTRSVPSGHTGEAPVRWRPAGAGYGAATRRPGSAGGGGAGSRAWLLEATADYWLLLSPVSRDGVQREVDGPHTALHFIGRSGEVISHHLACSPSKLTAQRYDDCYLFVKDPEEHPLSRTMDAMDDDALPEYSGVAGWLMETEDVAVPPLPVELPKALQGRAGCQAWSLAVTRGAIKETASKRQDDLDSAPRVYLLEEQAGLRLWATQRCRGSVLESLHDRHGLDGRQLVRQTLAFSPLPQSDQDVVEPGGAPAASSVPRWLLWSPEIRHAARLAGGAGPGGGKLGFWRCGVAFRGERSELQARHPQAYAAAAEERPWGRPAQDLPLGHGGWTSRRQLPLESARGARVVTGLPCFPTQRWGEGTYHSPQDLWLHPVGQDAVMKSPLSTRF